MTMVNDTDVLLAHIPGDGSAIGNTTLKMVLGWDEPRFNAARDPLLAAGIVGKGKGRGGSTKRLSPIPPADQR